MVKGFINVRDGWASLLRVVDLLVPPMPTDSSTLAGGLGGAPDSDIGYECCYGTPGCAPRAAGQSLGQPAIDHVPDCPHWIGFCTVCQTPVRTDELGAHAEEYHIIGPTLVDEAGRYCPNVVSGCSYVASGAGDLQAHLVDCAGGSLSEPVAEGAPALRGAWVYCYGCGEHFRTRKIYLDHPCEPHLGVRVTMAAGMPHGPYFLNKQ